MQWVQIMKEWICANCEHLYMHEGFTRCVCLQVQGHILEPAYARKRLNELEEECKEFSEFTG